MTAEMIDEVKLTVREAVSEAFHGQQQSPWRDSRKAAEYIGCTPGTLKTWRARGEGPRYHVINEKLVRYHVEDLDGFVRGVAR
ncbi:hypothetical protein AMEJIAPC_00426 [Caulobacter sp. NIBR1757]|nr:hypothetical protein AMEJIAPC_00426 [Caulobacter sp. NIBR1757]